MHVNIPSYLLLLAGFIVDGFHLTLREELVFGKMRMMLYCSYNESIFDRIL